jgi:hypothetical protein
MVKIEDHEYLCIEERRLKQDRERSKYWKKWGPYVAERQWATGKQYRLLVELENGLTFFPVREDYSADGDAWSRKSCAKSMIT